MSLLHWKYFSPFLVVIPTVRDPSKTHVDLDEEISGMPIFHNLAKIIF